MFSRESNPRGTPGPLESFAQLWQTSSWLILQDILRELSTSRVGLCGMICAVHGCGFILRRILCLPSMESSVGFSGWATPWKAGHWPRLYFILHMIVLWLEYCFPWGSNHFLFRFLSHSIRTAYLRNPLIYVGWNKRSKSQGHCF